MEQTDIPAAALAPKGANQAHLASWPAWRTALVSGLGGALAILILAEASDLAHAALLIAPFGASCVLVFALPQSPLAQPRNVIGGHLISAAVGLATYLLLGAHPWSFAIGVGGAIAAMQITGTVHPPAGADPIVVILAKASWPFLLSPVLVGTLTIVAVGLVYHRWGSRRAYPSGP
ncbi:MAG TPA: HPP family protein [Caulobacteraceae bacterium]|jgi:CBS-domain-containing membrane protein|nr:HPP family protein [Caulobacteraceae bacterium]